MTKTVPDETAIAASAPVAPHREASTIAATVSTPFWIG